MHCIDLAMERYTWAARTRRIPFEIYQWVGDFFCGLLIRQSGDAVSLRKVTACLTDVGREMRCPSVRHFVLALPLSVVRHLCSGATATGDVTAAGGGLIFA